MFMVLRRGTREASTNSIRASRHFSRMLRRTIFRRGFTSEFEYREGSVSTDGTTWQHNLARRIRRSNLMRHSRTLNRLLTFGQHRIA